MLRARYFAISTGFEIEGRTLSHSCALTYILYLHLVSCRYRQFVLLYDVLEGLGGPYVVDTLLRYFGYGLS